MALFNLARRLVMHRTDTMYVSVTELKATSARRGLAASHQYRQLTAANWQSTSSALAKGIQSSSSTPMAEVSSSMQILCRAQMKTLYETTSWRNSTCMSAASTSWSSPVRIETTTSSYLKFAEVSNAHNPAKGCYCKCRTHKWIWTSTQRGLRRAAE